MVEHLNVQNAIAIIVLLLCSVFQVMAIVSIKNSPQKKTKGVNDAFVLLLSSALTMFFVALLTVVIMVLVYNGQLSAKWLVASSIFSGMTIFTGFVLSALSASKLQCFYDNKDLQKRQLNSALGWSVWSIVISILAIAGMLGLRIWESRTPTARPAPTTYAPVQARPNNPYMQQAMRK